METNSTIDGNIIIIIMDKDVATKFHDVFKYHPHSKSRDQPINFQNSDLNDNKYAIMIVELAMD